MSPCWTVEETYKLLAVRAEDDIVTREITDIVGLIDKRLRQRGVCRTQAQIKAKLKALKKQYQQIAEHNDQSEGTKTWAYFALCEDIWGLRQSEKPATGAKIMEEPAACSCSTFPSASPSTSNCLDSSCTEEDHNKAIASGDESILSSGDSWAAVAPVQAFKTKRQAPLYRNV